MRKTTMMVSAVLCCGVFSQALAQDEKRLNEAVELRQAVMKIIKWNLGPMVGMVKEEIPFDADRFALGAERIAMAGSMIEDASRMDTRQATLASEALPLIWDEFAEYEELSEKLAASSAHLAEVAEGGDPGASRQAFLDMTKDCKACHDKFREKK